VEEGEKEILVKKEEREREKERHLPNVFMELATYLRIGG